MWEFTPLRVPSRLSEQGRARTGQVTLMAMMGVVPGRGHRMRFCRATSESYRLAGVMLCDLADWGPAPAALTADTVNV